jgi:hypothetical protein
MIAPVATAGTAEELLKTPGLSDDERAAIAKAIGKSGPASSIPQTIKGMLEWREMGDAFAQTIKQVCQTLNVEVNAFLKSDVGKLTAAVIIYKMVGRDLLRIILYTSIWLGMTFCFAFSIKFLHMKKKVKRLVEKDNKSLVETHYEDRFNWDDNDIARIISLILHLIVWFVFSCVVAGNIL